MARIEVNADWYEAGRYDAEHGLMPPPVHVLPPGSAQASAYALGYRRCGVGFGFVTNTYPDAQRPRSPEEQGADGVSVSEVDAMRLADAGASGRLQQERDRKQESGECDDEDREE